MFSKTLAQQYPESFDPNVPEQLIYQGQKSLTDTTNTPLDAGKLLLSPTRTYAPIIKAILNQVDRKLIHGMVHCSGGAQTKILHFIDKLHVIKNNLFDAPPLFKLIQDQSGTDWKEMYQVFNMGHRMELYVPEMIANKLISISQSYGVDAQVIGRVEASTKKQLTILSPYGEFGY